MQITGIICEYNPFHLGHKKQLDAIRTAQGTDCGIVCLMSGNFVQRGSPAILDKSLRAKAAIISGADLVLELPVTAALSSAEGFAAKGVAILSPFCQKLCFGTETTNADILLHTARTLLSQEFREVLRRHLDKGLSFPAARQAALETMGMDGCILTKPNDILAIEYCKAILSQGSAMEPMPIHRGGAYHDTDPDAENPSATAIRRLMETGIQWHRYVPEEVATCFENAGVHTLLAGERAILGRLRSMTDRDFEALPYGSEGLWRKLMHAARSSATLEAILTATKSKRYTRTRLDRMILCAFLGIPQTVLDAPIPYVRALAFNDRGRQILKKIREFGSFPNIGETVDHPYQQLETRCADLYGLFHTDSPAPAGTEKEQRIYYHK